MVMDICDEFSYDNSPHKFILILLFILQVLLLAGSFFFDFDLVGIVIAYSFQSGEVELQYFKHQLYIAVFILLHLLVGLLHGDATSWHVGKKTNDRPEKQLFVLHHHSQIEVLDISC
jgi:hypothetical protein